MDLVNLALKSIFTENILLAYFLGMCSYLVLSKKIETAFGLGLAVIFVSTITAPVNWFIYNFILKEGALSWLAPLFEGGSTQWIAKEIRSIDLSYLTFIFFIVIIAGIVHLVEMVVEKTSEHLHHALGIYLPLITVNCSILGVSLFVIEREYSFIEATVFGFSSGIGWLLAIVSMAAIRYKLRYSNIPEGMKGLGITMLVTGLIALAFMIFSGISLGN